jgi:hypothetical protein
MNKATKKNPCFTGPTDQDLAFSDFKKKKLICQKHVKKTPLILHAFLKKSPYM